MPAAKPRPTAAELAKLHFDDDDAQSDTPILHRKHHAGDAQATGSAKSGAGGDSSAPAAPSDPDRPVLKKKPASDSASNSSATAPSSSTDPDRPTLHKKDASTESDANSSPSDPDRPVLKKSVKREVRVADADDENTPADPDRPRLKRGKTGDLALEVMPTLAGLPEDMHQAVAVSDAKFHPEHQWTYAWSNRDDEERMKESLEEMAREALGLTPPPAPAPKRTTAKKPAKPAAPAPPPVELEGEQFRVFELAYGTSATLVLTAHTSGPLAQQKFVTLIAQPDLYGNVLVLMKHVTDGAHLDEKPRLKLIDAVDALADNRGELLFELRGATQRQFALYRVWRGQTERLFVTGGGEFSMADAQ